MGVYHPKTSMDGDASKIEGSRLRKSSLLSVRNIPMSMPTLFVLQPESADRPLRNATLFDRNLEERRHCRPLWPLKRFPVLLDDGRCILESNTIVGIYERTIRVPSA